MFKKIKHLLKHMFDPKVYLSGILKLANETFIT